MKDRSDKDALRQAMSLLFRAHPWHGVPIGKQAPELVNSYVEILPTDTIKYELDKVTGLLKVDRPQKFSSMPPMLYGLIPRTYCGEQLAAICRDKTGRQDIVGDADPIDICILTEKTIDHSNIIVPAVPIGGFRMIDGNEADDKIIAFLHGDLVYSQWKDIDDVPKAMIERLRHYFLTYKDIPGTKEHVCEITHIYGREEAYEVIRASQRDYDEKYPDLSGLMAAALKASK